MTRRRLRIAYLCDIDPCHINPYSGGNTRIHAALSARADVTVLPQDWGLAEPIRRLIYRLPEGAGLRLRWRTHLILSRIIARRVHGELKRGDYDVLFGAYSFQSMAAIRPPAPMVSAFTSDATPTVYKRSEIGQSFGSTWFSRTFLDPLTLQAERRIFPAQDLLLWPSQWLFDGACALYDLKPDQAHVVPWGANIDDPGPATTPPRLAPGGPINLLVVGRDWFAKGGPVAFDTMKALRARGHDARLTVIGATPPDFHRNEFTHILGPLDKSIAADKARFETAYGAAHFLVQPSVESYGFAFCEASAHGLPSLCQASGGVPVRDGINGHALPAGATPEDFANLIDGYAADPARYDALRRSARQEYTERLNWDAWGDRVVALMSDLVSNRCP